MHDICRIHLLHAAVWNIISIPTSKFCTENVASMIFIYIRISKIHNLITERTVRIHLYTAVLLCIWIWASCLSMSFLFAWGTQTAFHRQDLVPADFSVVEILLMPTNGSPRAGFFLCLFWTCNIGGDISWAEGGISSHTSTTCKLSPSLSARVCWGGH